MALSLNVPVICSDLDVFRESGRDFPVFIDPMDAAAWKKAILEADKLPEINVPKDILPSWDAHFDKLESNLDTIEVEEQIRHPLRLMSFDAGIWNKIKASLVAFLLYVTPDKTVRKFLKFKRTPVQAMIDTRFKPVHKLGKFLTKG